MSAYSEDLRRRIVSSVEAGMPKAQAARTFRVSLSSVKRYANKAQKGTISGSEEEAGGRPQARREGHEAPGGGPQQGAPLRYPLRERREYIELMTGLSVSRSTVCRAIARIGRTRKKGGESPRSVTGSRGRLGG
jgi:transposase